MKQLQIHPSFHVTDREQERFNVIQLLVRHYLYLPEGYRGHEGKRHKPRLVDDMRRYFQREQQPHTGHSYPSIPKEQTLKTKQR